MGPDTDTAATTLPVHDTGALTEATPRSRSSTLWAQPRSSTVGLAGQDLGRRAAVHGQGGPDRHDGAQAVRRFERQPGTPGCRRTGRRAGRSRRSRRASSASAGASRVDQRSARWLPPARPRRTRPGPSTKRPARSRVHQQVALQGGGQPVGGGPRQAGRARPARSATAGRSRGVEDRQRPCPGRRHRLHSLPQLENLSQNVRRPL